MDKPKEENIVEQIRYLRRHVADLRKEAERKPVLADVIANDISMVKGIDQTLVSLKRMIESNLYLLNMSTEAIKEEPKANDISPWQDYKGAFIRHGDRVRHPDGTEGVARLMPRSETGRGGSEHDWFVDYGNDSYALLQLQVGEKGRLEVVGK